MNMADQLADEIYGLHCDIGRLENENARLRGVVSDGELHAREILAENATLRQQLADVTESMGRVEEQCVKLRELAELLLYGATHDAEPAEALVWSHKVDVLARELGIEVN